MKKKNFKLGFTLIELLLVISVLSLLVMAVIPVGLNIYREAKKKTLELKVEGIVDAVKVGYNFATMDLIVTDTIYYYSGGKLTKTGNIDVEYNGAKIQNGVFYIKYTGETAIALYEDDYCATKAFDSSTIKIEKTLLVDCAVDGISAVPEEPPVPLEPTLADCFTFDNGTITDYNHLDPNCPSDVVIPEEINEIPVTIIGNNAFKFKNLTSVVIPEGVTTINSQSFYYNRLESIEIPNSVTSIGYQAFSSNGMTNLDLGNGVQQILWNAFDNNLLTNVSFPNSLTEIYSNAFTDNQLNSITFGNNISKINPFAFSNNQLTSIDIPSNITSIGVGTFNNNQLSDEQAFLYFRNSNGTWNNTKLIGYGGARKNDIVIPSTVVTIEENAFGVNRNINNVTIPSSVRNIEQSAFSGIQLKSVIIENGVTTIKADAFRSNQLTNITIPASVTAISTRAFASNQLTTITILSSSVAIESNMLTTSNDNFKESYITYGTGTYVGTQEGTWAKQ